MALSGLRDVEIARDHEISRLPVDGLAYCFMMFYGFCHLRCLKESISCCICMSDHVSTPHHVLIKYKRHETDWFYLKKCYMIYVHIITYPDSRISRLMYEYDMIYIYIHILINKYKYAHTHIYIYIYSPI